MRVFQLKKNDWGTVENILAPLLTQLEQDSKHIFTPEDVRNRFLREIHQLWLVVSQDGIVAIVGTHVDTYPWGLKILELEYCIGERAVEAAEIGIREIEAFAREQGCHRMRGAVRKGWARVLKDFDVSHVVISKELHDGR